LAEKTSWEIAGAITTFHSLKKKSAPLDLGSSLTTKIVMCDDTLSAISALTSDSSLTMSERPCSVEDATSCLESLLYASRQLALMKLQLKIHQLQEKVRIAKSIENHPGNRIVSGVPELEEEEEEEEGFPTEYWRGDSSSSVGSSSTTSSQESLGSYLQKTTERYSCQLENGVTSIAFTHVEMDCNNQVEFALAAQ